MKRVQLQPQLEYSWEDRLTAAIRWLARHLPIADRMRHPGDLTAGRLIKLAQKLVSLRVPPRAAAPPGATS